jgi:hypothetical protein
LGITPNFQFCFNVNGDSAIIIFGRLPDPCLISG